MTIHINRTAEKNMGDFASECWPKNHAWQNVREELLVYFEETKAQQFQTPLSTGDFLKYLTSYHQKRKNEKTNCFSYTCEMIADGITIEPTFLAYAGLERLLQDEPFELTSTKGHVYDVQFAQTIADSKGMIATLKSIGFSETFTPNHNATTPVIALIQPNQDYHFLKVVTGMSGDLQRVAFLEHTGNGAAYHDNPHHYFSSLEYAGRARDGYGRPALIFPPNAVKNLKLSGCMRTDYQDRKPVACHYKAKASYTP